MNASFPLALAKSINYSSHLFSFTLAASISGREGGKMKIFAGYVRTYEYVRMYVCMYIDLSPPLLSDPPTGYIVIWLIIYISGAFSLSYPPTLLEDQLYQDTCLQRTS